MHSLAQHIRVTAVTSLSPAYAVVVDTRTFVAYRINWSAYLIMVALITQGEAAAIEVLERCGVDRLAAPATLHSLLGDMTRRNWLRGTAAISCEPSTD